MTMAVLATLLLAVAFVFSGLDAAWQALDRVRLRHRADKGDRRAKSMLAWQVGRPQADLVLGWTSHTSAALSLVLLCLALAEQDDTAWWWVAPALFLPVYSLFVEVVARQVFRRLPFMVLSRLWWLVVLAGSFWAPLARPAARWLRNIPPDPLPRLPADEELLALTARIDSLSPLELSMLRSVMDFRRLSAGGLALPLEHFACVASDRPLGEILADRQLADAPWTLVVGADGLPLGAMSCGTAVLSEATGARAQSFARPLLSFPASLGAWQALTKLRRAQTPVAEVYDEVTGQFTGILTEQTAVARLLGQPV